MISRRWARAPSESLPLLAILETHTSYEDRLDAVLAYVSERCDLPDAYLYLAHPGGRHLHLERTRTSAAAAPPEESSEVMGSDHEGGVAWNIATPPFELGRHDGDDLLRAVDSPVGRLLALPLHTSSGRFVGLVHAGPLNGAELPKDAAPLHAAIESTTAMVVAAAVREEAAKRRAALAESQLESSRRVAASALDVKQLIGLLLDLALTSTGTEAGFVAIADADGHLRIADQRGISEGVLDAIDLEPDTGLFDWSLGELSGSLILSDVDKAQELGIRSLLAVPLIERGERLGIFALLTFRDVEPLDERGLDLLSAFSDQIRLMLHNARVFAEFSERYLDTLNGLAESLDALRPEYADHHRRVSQVGRALATGLGMNHDEVAAITAAGLIHDVGMVAMSGTEGAFEVDIQHPAVGASLVERLPLHRSVAYAVACHHEWFDGWGFPAGLEGRAIPRAGRVLAMAEFLVEMSTADAARPAWSARQLLNEIRQRRGSQFDPEVTDLTARLIESRAPELIAAAIAADTNPEEV